MANKTESFRSGVSLYTSRAIDLLQSGVNGDKITRDQMSSAVGRDCSPSGNGYGSVQSAIKKVERERGIVWRWIKADQAWVCLNDSQMVSEVGRYRTKATRVARRGIRVAACVDAKKLTQAELQEYSISSAQLAVLEMTGRGDTTKKLEHQTQVKTPKLDDMLKVFS